MSGVSYRSIQVYMVIYKTFNKSRFELSELPVGCVLNPVEVVRKIRAFLFWFIASTIKKRKRKKLEKTHNFKATVLTKF